jgi:hypothetical protein
MNCVGCHVEFPNSFARWTDELEGKALSEGWYLWPRKALPPVAGVALCPKCRKAELGKLVEVLIERLAGPARR